MDPAQERDRVSRLELLDALLVALDRRHEVSDVVWASEDSDRAVERLRELLGVSEVAAIEILNTQWRRFTRDGRQFLQDAVSELRDRA
jgi:DNA gyrase/topoisomerase IV subunit A